MPAISSLLIAALVVTEAERLQPPANPQPPAPVQVSAGERIEVRGQQKSVRGRFEALTGDELILWAEGTRIRLPLQSVQRIDRVGDSLLNGTAIGAAIGGGSALALMAKACSNTNCSDTSSNLDPRFTLLGTLLGAGVGALVDAAMEGRTTIFRAGQAPPQLRSRPQMAAASNTADRVMVFGRVGWAGFSDDEGSLGSGTTSGVGVIVPIWRNIGLQVAYNRHDHRRDLESPGPPGTQVHGGFSGTEQIVTAKTLFFFRQGQAFRPYAGLGIGWLDSERVSEFPTFELQPNGIVSPGPSETFRYHSQESGLGVSVGADARVARRVSVLGDLTLDLTRPSAFGSTRLTIGAGWRF
jgi:Outer membrane protein beta-barrel domain